MSRTFAAGDNASSRRRTVSTPVPQYESFSNNHNNRTIHHFDQPETNETEIFDSDSSQTNPVIPEETVHQSENNQETLYYQRENIVPIPSAREFFTTIAGTEQQAIKYVFL